MYARMALVYLSIHTYVSLFKKSKHFVDHFTLVCQIFSQSHMCTYLHTSTFRREFLIKICVYLKKNHYCLARSSFVDILFSTFIYHNFP